MLRKNNVRIKKSALVLATVSLVTFNILSMPRYTNLNTYNAVYAEAGWIGVNIDNKEVKTDVSPVIENGRTLVPIRVIADNLGFEVKWDQASRTATLVKDGISYFITVGDKKITTSEGAVVALDVPAKVKDGRTMLPLRAIVEISGASVKWDSNSRTVFINSQGGEIKIPDAPKKETPKPSKPLAKQELKTISYNGKTVPLEGKWKIENGDIWAYVKFHEDVNLKDDRRPIDTIEKLNGGHFGQYSIDGTQYAHSDTYIGDYTDMPKNGDWYNYSVALRSFGLEPEIVNGDIRVPTHPTQQAQDEYMDRHNKIVQSWRDADKEREALEAKMPEGDQLLRTVRLAEEVPGISDLGYSFKEVRPYDRSKVKDIKYVLEWNEIGDWTVINNRGPLKPGDLFAIGNDLNNSRLGLQKGFYVFQISSHAKAIHPSGDLRYGWEDTRFNDYAMKMVNIAREQDDLYSYDYQSGDRGKSSRITHTMSTDDVSFNWHRQQMIEKGGTKPVTWGITHDVFGHAPGAYEINAYVNKDIRNIYRRPDGQHKKAQGFQTLVLSPDHFGFIIQDGITGVGAMNIYRPDLSEMLIMTFE